MMARISFAFCILMASAAMAQTDPGPRAGPAGAGGAAPGLSTDETNFFLAARARFQEVDSVSGKLLNEAGVGLGPSFNANSCAACHAQPAVGGTSPHPTLGQVRTPNPQVGFASLDRMSGFNQIVPSFIRLDGPVREARFILNPDGTKDGGVHGLYTIAGRTDAPNCTAPQPDFATQLANNNVIFRIPTPVFGLGLVENTSDNALIGNLNATASQRQSFAIGGRFNTNGNDGTITRFGWKAQNKSLLVFAGEAYNVEQGVTNELFTNERAMAAGCELNATPEDNTNLHNPNTTGLTGTASEMSSDVVNFAVFMRMSAPAAPTTASTSELHGKSLFVSVGCALCHTTTLISEESPLTGQTAVQYHPYSDFAIHHMGPGLADRVSQGRAGPDEFRSAPLWGVGQRIFFLHDGRSGPGNGGLLHAIQAHASSNPNCAYGQISTPDGIACRSEANVVLNVFNSLSTSDKQDLLNFLRSL
jgi:CxxC motif-containing protein (DUF1111 family)